MPSPLILHQLNTIKKQYQLPILILLLQTQHWLPTQHQLLQIQHLPILHLSQQLISLPWPLHHCPHFILVFASSKLPSWTYMYQGTQQLLKASSMLIYYSRTGQYASTVTDLTWAYHSVIIWGTSLHTYQVCCCVNLYSYNEWWPNTYLSWLCPNSLHLFETLFEWIYRFPYLQGLTLAHPITNDENFHVSVLIGADCYWQFIQDHVVRGNGSTAVQSRLGYLLSGPLPLSQPSDTINLHASIFYCTTEHAQSRFWNVESYTCSGHLRYWFFYRNIWPPRSQYNQMEPITSSFLGRILTQPFPCICYDLWFTDWQKHQHF